MKIVIAVDGTEFLTKFHEFIERFFPGIPKEIHVLHVIPSYAALMDTYPEIKQVVHRQAEELVKKVMDFFTDLDAQLEGIVLEGTVTKMILEYSNQKSVDAIILGCRSLTNYSTLSLGSVSLGIANQSQIPVMIVK
ncbi:universal stress protein [Brevibacillus ginsengisoli]|uniref:universal stress protein n=1 Tax=Brevibacillus ginsengisoli TaxID=363854 RepID=UPI003CF199D3